MNILKKIICIATLSTISLGAFAQSISATGSTLDSAESHIAEKAKAAGDYNYTITSARTDNGVYMTAKLIK